MKKKIVYIAHPIGGDVKGNIEKEELKSKEDLLWDEQMYEIWKEAMDDECAFHAALKRQRDRIFKVLSKVKGKKFVKDLQNAMEEWECNGETKLVRKVYGSWQVENYGSFKRYCVDQYSSGDSGDSFYGNIFVEVRKATLVKPALYIQMGYSC